MVSHARSQVKDEPKPPASGGFGSVRSEKSSERIYESLLHAIVTGKLARGCKLPSEAELASNFGVSRPILRQALDRLRVEELIESIRGSGSYVRSTPTIRDSTLGDTREMMPRVRQVLAGLEFRLIVEPEAAFFAASRCGPADIAKMHGALDAYEAAIRAGDIAHHFDFRFHESIAIATANPRIVAALESLEYDVSHSVDLMRHLSHFEPIERSRTVATEHRKILSCIEEGDAEGARRAMRNHIERARIRMLNSRTDV